MYMRNTLWALHKILKISSLENILEKLKNIKNKSIFLTRGNILDKQKACWKHSSSLQCCSSTSCPILIHFLNSLQNALDWASDYPYNCPFWPINSSITTCWVSLRSRTWKSCSWHSNMRSNVVTAEHSNLSLPEIHCIKIFFKNHSKMGKKYNYQ